MNLTLTPLCQEELDLLAVMRSIGFGNMTIHIQNGKPVRIEEMTKSTKLPLTATKEVATV